MIYDYSAAGLWKDVVLALVLTENGGVEPTHINVIGDGGRAIGILQQHPAFFQEYYGRSISFPASPTDTWDRAQIKAAASFLQRWHTLGKDLLIQGYNQGINGVTRIKDPARAPDYLARFNQYFAQIDGRWPV